jgi:hypothetical protein
MTTFVVGVVALLFAASVGAILLTKDSTKFWDHIARSLVQTGLAVGTVAVAVFLFKEQLFEQDKRNLNQQTLLATTNLREIISKIGDDWNRLPRLSEIAWNVDCDQPIQKCDLIVAENRFLEMARGHLTALYAGAVSPIFPDSSYSADIRQLLRGNYAFKESTMNLLLDQLHSYEFGLSWTRKGVDNFKIEVGDKSAMARQDLSPAEISRQFLALIKLQKEVGETSVTFVCRLVRTKELLERAETPSGADKDMRLWFVQGISCPPFDPPFRAILAWDEKTKNVREVIKSAPAPISPAVPTPN